MKQIENATDAQLVARIQEHDNDALGELYRRYFAKVYQKCLTMIKDEDAAFDLAEESLIKAFENLKGFRGHASFSTWLYTITHRHCLEAIRRQKKTVVDSTEDLSEAEQPSTDLGESIDNEEQHTIMLALVDALPKPERELLVAKYTNGESIEQLQESYAASPSAIKMRLMRTKEKLNHLYALATVIGLQAVLSQLEQL
ncbi:MAG TPA: RNA polymerase sigma factor [Chryseolinea sp.]|nr:RNA polymerase sigma factor [Chryseolinea sp.]